MLAKLTVKNFALIENAEIIFTDGMNVLSGETGAGKSVIIESINFVLGGKPDRAFIRHGTEECSVTAEFDVSDNPSIGDIFDELDFDKEDVLIISRKFSVMGKSSVRINGNSATIGMLKKFTSHLIDVHGQSEHFELLSTSNQLKLLDKYGGEEIAAIKNELKSNYNAFRTVNDELEELGGNEDHRLIRLDVLDFQIKEIEDCAVKEGEEENLLAIRERIIQKERLLTALSAVKSAISDEGGVSDILGNAVRSVQSVSQFGQEYEDLYSRLSAVYSETEDISETAGEIEESLSEEGLDPDALEERLEKIKKIKKKYGGSFEEINVFLENAKSEKEILENFNETAEKLLLESEKLKDVLYKNYASLDNVRRKYAKQLENNVLAELAELKMDKSKFAIVFSALPDKSDCKFDSANGANEVEFFFSANLGEPLKPLSSVISGGEMSRFMLSVKAQSAKYNDISTFIFDEIDAGISGAVAKVVARKLCRISKEVQVIAISHLPQITSFADNNLLIYKHEKDGLTYTSVKKLSDVEKTAEIVRLVGGTTDNASATALAESLICEAEEYKRSV